MIKRTLLLLIGVMALASALRAQPIAYDYDRGTDFNKFNTYAWLAPGDSVLNRYRSDKLFGGYIIYAANNELKKKGLVMDTLKPDAIFVFYTSVEEITTYSQTATLSIGVGVAGPGYYVSGYAPVAGGKIIADTAQDGMLKYVMYDTESREIVWWGMAEKTFKPSDDVENLIRDYTAKIFKKYPKKKK